MADSDYITIEEAQRILGLSLRQVHNYIAAEKFQTRKEGRRRMLLASDVYVLADELGATAKEPPPTVEMLPDTGPLIDYIKELTGQLMIATRRIGELEGQMQHRLLPEDVAPIREELAISKAEAARYETEVNRLQEQLKDATMPWWRRLTR